MLQQEVGGLPSPLLSFLVPDGFENSCKAAMEVRTGAARQIINDEEVKAAVKAAWGQPLLLKKVI